MSNRPRSESDIPGAPQQASGDFIAKIGKLPKLERGQMVWIYVQDRWYAGQVGRRLPGDVYWVRITPPVGGCANFVVHVGNFGGPW